jgi:hypothetical protein
MDPLNAMEKLTGVRFDKGLPVFTNPAHQRAWTVLEQATGQWLTPKEIAESADVRYGKVAGVLRAIGANQVAGVRDGMRYVLVSREVPGRKWKRFDKNRCQVRLVPNTFDETGWRRGRGLKVDVSQRRGHPRLTPLRPAALGAV